MSSYVITGVSKGIGVRLLLLIPRYPLLLTPSQYELLKQISRDPQNLVVGLVRDVAATKLKLASEQFTEPNIYLLHGDLTSYASLKAAAGATVDIVGKRGVDYLVGNGAYASQFDAYNGIGEL